MLQPAVMAIFAEETLPLHLYVSLMSLANASRRSCSPERSPYLAFSGSAASFPLLSRYASFGPTAGTPYLRRDKEVSAYCKPQIDGGRHSPETASGLVHACRRIRWQKPRLLELAQDQLQPGMGSWNMLAAWLRLVTASKEAASQLN